ncbi:MAG: hypothetical protein Q8L39_15840 [Burkholderiales bacterium]|nr:hypothetical protein [Burkholderiales bacterium]
MYIATVLLIVVLALVAFFIALVNLFKKGYFKTIAVILLSSFFAYEAFQYYWYSLVLPSQIQITYPVSIGDESGFREGCGVAVFKVSDKTIEAIQKNGLKFFDGATQGRGYPKPSEPLSFSDRKKLSDYYYHTYETWKETPVPPGWVSEGSLFMCSVIRDDVAREIVKAAKLPGSFYTTKPEGQLFVIPSLGYVVFSYYG